MSIEEMEQATSGDQSSGSQSPSRPSSTSRSPVKRSSPEASSPPRKRQYPDDKQLQQRNGDGRRGDSREPMPPRESDAVTNDVHAVNGAENSNKQHKQGDKDSNKPVASKLHISKLSRNVTTEHLAEIFGVYGTVINTSLVTDQKVGLPKGGGYVEYSTAEEACTAVDYMNGAQIDGKIIRVALVHLPRTYDPAVPLDRNNSKGFTDHAQVDMGQQVATGHDDGRLRAGQSPRKNAGRQAGYDKVDDGEVVVGMTWTGGEINISKIGHVAGAYVTYVTHLMRKSRIKDVVGVVMKMVCVQEDEMERHDHHRGDTRPHHRLDASQMTGTEIGIETAAGMARSTTIVTGMTEALTITQMTAMPRDVRVTQGITVTAATVTTSTGGPLKAATENRLEEGHVGVIERMIGTGVGIIGMITDAGIHLCAGPLSVIVTIARQGVDVALQEGETVTGGHLCGAGTGEMTEMTAESDHPDAQPAPHHHPHHDHDPSQHHDHHRHPNHHHAGRIAQTNPAPPHQRAGDNTTLWTTLCNTTLCSSRHATTPSTLCVSMVFIQILCLSYYMVSIIWVGLQITCKSHSNFWIAGTAPAVCAARQDTGKVGVVVHTTPQRLVQLSYTCTQQCCVYLLLQPCLSFVFTASCQPWKWVCCSPVSFAGDEG